MNKSSVILEKERDFTDLMNGTFAFIGQEFKMLLKTIGLYAGILIILSAIADAYYADATISNIVNMAASSGDYSVFATTNWKLWSLLSATQFLTQFLIGGLVCAYMVVYRDKGRGNFEVTDVWKAFIGKLPLALMLTFVVFLMICIGMMFCFLPGIYLLVPLSLVLMVLYAENVDFGNAISRSFKLVSGNWWFTFGFIIVVSIIVSIIGYIFSLPAVIIGIVQGVSMITEEAAELSNSAAIIVSTVVSAVGQYFIVPVLHIAVALQYFNLKERKDKTSLFRKVSEIGNN
ncbi:MAG: hypothetical protein LBV41_05795 [Cytophagaceae bacterium]|jgi:hypothetical protein|nr:hypothetical protein [Cytophagaceae bacterium]